MKYFVTVLFAVASFSAFSAVEFYGRKVNEECTIVKNTVTKTVTYQKGLAGFSTTSIIKTFGIDALVEKAVLASTSRTSGSGDFEFKVTVDGVTTKLNFEDSPEAALLSQFIMKACF